MGISRIDGVRVKPGRLNDHIEMVGQVSNRLRDLGLSSLRLYSIVVGGPATGTVYSVYEAANLAAYGAALDLAEADDELRGLLAEIYGPDGPAEPTGVSLLTEIAPNPDQAGNRMQVATVRSARVKPGRFDEVPALIEDARPLAQRFGGTLRLYSTIVGGSQTGTLFISVGYPNNEALGTGLEAATADGEVRTMLERMFGSSGPVDLISTSIHRELSAW